MGLKEIYTKAEDAYYGVLDRLNKVIPVYAVIDPVDKFVPSFVLVIGLLIALVAGGAYLVWQSQSLEAYVQVLDETGAPLNNLELQLEINGQPATISTGPTGTATVKLATQNVNGIFSVEVENYRKVERRPELLEAGKYVRITLERESIALSAPITIQFVDEDSGELVSGKTVSVSFSCSQGSAPASKTTRVGELTVEKPAACGTLSAREVRASGYETVNDFELAPGPSNKVQVSLKLLEAPVSDKGTLVATVLDHTSAPVGNAQVRVFDSFNVVAARSQTTALGIVSFSLDVGSYQVDALLETEGRFSDKNSVTIVKDQTARVVLNVGAPPTDKKILYRFVDEVTNEPVEGANVKLFSDTNILVESRLTDDNGVFEQPIQNASRVYSLIVDHPNYVLHVIPAAALKARGETVPTEAALARANTNAGNQPVNFGLVQVEVLNEERGGVEEALVQLFRSDINIALAEKRSDSEGHALFTRLPPGNYRARAIAEDSNAVSAPGTLSVAQTLSLEIVLSLSKRVFAVTVVNALSPSTKVNNAEVEVWVTGAAGTAPAKRETGRTGSNGEFEALPIPVGSTVFFRVTRSDYLSFHSAPYFAFTGAGSERIRLQFGVYPAANLPAGSAPDVRFVEVLDASGQKSPPVMEAGKTYWGVFDIVLPVEAFSNVRLSLRAGPNSIADAAHNTIFVENAASEPAPDALEFSARLNPENVFESPAPVLPNEKTKVLNAAWNQLPSGVYQFKAKFSVKEGLSRGTVVALNYQARGSASAGVQTTPDKSQTFEVGKKLCSRDCPPLHWAFFLATPENPVFEPFDVENPPALITNQVYRIGYVVYNLTSETLNAGLVFENPDKALSLDRVIAKASTTAFSNQSIPAGTALEYGLGTPLELQPQEALSGLLLAQLNSSLSSEQSGQAILFEIAGDDVLAVNTTYDGTTLRVIVRDAATSEFLEGALVEIGSKNSGNTFEGFTGAAEKSGLTAENGTAQFEAALTGNDFVIVQVRKAGYLTRRTIVSSSTVLTLNPSATCLSFDLVSATPYPAVESSVTLSRGSALTLEVRSDNCPGVYDLKIETPSFLDSGDITVENNSFELEASAVHSAQVRISGESPVGIIPIWLSGKVKGSSEPEQVISVGEIHLTRNDHVDFSDVCFALVEKTQ